MMRSLNPVSLACVLLAGTLAAPLRADDLADKGRAIYTKNQQAVVIVQLVMKTKVSYPGAGERSAEARQDATGTVIDPSGLTVLSLSSTDPTIYIENMMSGRGEEAARVKMESELSDIKILLEDGTEVPAEVVLRDKDLDLAFLRPKVKPAAPMAAVDLSQAGKADVLDQVITVNRLGSAAGRAYAASVERICAIVRRPRLFYIPDSMMTATTMGTPAFTLEGKPLGLFVYRTVKGQTSSAMFGIQGQAATSIILPAEDILKAAKQAPAAGAAEEKKDH